MNEKKMLDLIANLSALLIKANKENEALKIRAESAEHSEMFWYQEAKKETASSANEAAPKE